jgi:hypothetical protein
MKTVQEKRWFGPSLPFCEAECRPEVDHVGPYLSYFRGGVPDRRPAWINNIFS